MNMEKDKSNARWTTNITLGDDPTLKEPQTEAKIFLWRFNL